MNLFFLNGGSKLLYIINFLSYNRLKCSAYLIIKITDCNSSIL